MENIRDESNEWTLRNKIIFVISLVISTTIGVIAINENYPSMIYIAISAFLTSALVFLWKEEHRDKIILLCSLLFYSMFWVIRDAIRGFYTDATIFEYGIALLPTIFSLIWFRFRNAKWWVYVLVTIAHFIATYFMNSTDNELIAILCVLALSDNLSNKTKLLFYSLLWYQVYLASTKYMLSDYPKDEDVIYFIALVPYLTYLVFIFIQRISHK